MMTSLQAACRRRIMQRVGLGPLLFSVLGQVSPLGGAYDDLTWPARRCPRASLGSTRSRRRWRRRSPRGAAGWTPSGTYSTLSSGAPPWPACRCGTNSITPIWKALNP